MNKRLKNMFIYVIFLVVNVLISSLCVYASEEKANDTIELDLSEWKSDDIYCYEGIEWGSERETVENQLGISLSLIDSSIPTYFYPDKKAILFDRTGKFDFEFRPGLEVICISFYADEGEELSEFLEKVLDELVSYYGEYEMSQSKLKKGYRCYSWLNLDETKSGSSIQVQITTRDDKENGDIDDVRLYIGTIHGPDYYGAKPEENLKDTDE